MHKINHNSDIAMYKQLTNIIISQIKEGELSPGDRLPSEAELVRKYNISRVTVRAALKNLEEDGILVRSQGKGTFVASPKSCYKADDHIGFTRSCRLAGKHPKTSLLKSEMVYPSDNTKQFLRLGDEEQVIMTERLHFVDERPISIETNYYPKKLEFILKEDLEGSLFEMLEQKFHIFIEHSTRTLEVCYSTPYEAKLLEIKRGTPLLLFKDRLVDAAGNPLLFSKQVYCTENMEFYLY